MTETVRHIVVVGGGSAGWMSATLLSSLLQEQGCKFSVTLIESARVGRIGVGEATIPTMRDTLKTIGLDETAFLNSCDATFKQGILFKDWHRLGTEYFHPFAFRTLSEDDKIAATADWLRSDRSAPYISSISEQPALALRGLAPKTAHHKPFRGPLSYAYHMDAEKFADMLAADAAQWGITHLVDEVTTVERTPNGDIAAVLCLSGEQVAGDLFIDCTGFARRLIGQEMGAQFTSYGDWLLCDRAVAFRIPTDGKTLPPYTTSTALSAGWVWQIHLQGRMGAGYVFSSVHLDPAEAEAELRSQLTIPEDIPARHISFASGRLDRAWIRNCVAIGLSAGFLEPLESTGLFFIEEGAKMLAGLFPEGREMDQIAQLYNRRLAAHYEECLDFINLHYSLTVRQDTAFWRDVSQEARTTPRLREMLARWEQKMPTSFDFEGHRRLFVRDNWAAILFGMSDPRPGGAATKATHAITAATNRLSLTLPKHEALVETLSSLVKNSR